MLKTIVTGGAGFIGSNLIRHLLKDENYLVLNIDKLCFPGSVHTLADVADHSRYSFEKKDITDRESMTGILADFSPDTIIHLAAESHVDRSIENPLEFVNTNIIGTVNLLDMAKSHWIKVPACFGMTLI